MHCSGLPAYWSVLVAFIAALLLASHPTQSQALIPLSTRGSTATVSGGNYLVHPVKLCYAGIMGAASPAGSIVGNDGGSIWQSSTELGTICVMIILAALVLSLYLAFKEKKLKAIKNSLLRLNGQLINAQEEERSVVASQLHDDFSQRIALLSLSLESVADKITDSPAKAREELRQILNTASEIGSDLQTLSDRLHSATLESLGLVAGIRSFCREFSIQQGIEVDFKSTEIPFSVPAKASLGLFRVVQEGLCNVRKHSGTTEAHIELFSTRDTLHLSIWDNGCGFDKATIGERGLGIQSMAERCRIMNARFGIQSEINRGTRITVALPIRIGNDIVGTGMASRIA